MTSRAGFDDDGPQPRRRSAKRNSDLRPLAEALPAPPSVVADDGVEDPDWAERERRALYEEGTPARRERSGLPPGLRGLAFGDLDRSESRARAETIAAAEAWAEGRERGLVLTGARGIGKTRIAATAAWERARRSSVRWLPVAELLLSLSLPFGSPERERAARKLDPGRGRVALVLDDLDKLSPTDHALSPLYVAVNGWVEAALPLFVTTNRSLDGLAADFGERFGATIASRLAGYCVVSEMSGRDRRVQE